MLLDYEAGNLARAQSTSSTSRQQVQLNLFKIDSAADGAGKYNLKLLQPNTGSDGDVDDSSDLTADDLGKEYDAPDSQTYLGIYPPEIDTGTNSLPDDSIVVAMTRRIQSGDDGDVLVAVIVGGNAVDSDFVSITGNQAGGGKYLGQLYKLNTTGTINLSSNLSISDFATAYTPSGVSSVVVCNLPEISTSFHSLSSGAVGKVLSRHLQDDGKLIVTIAAYAVFDCS